MAAATLSPASMRELEDLATQALVKLPLSKNESNSKPGHSTASKAKVKKQKPAPAATLAASSAGQPIMKHSNQATSAQARPHSSRDPSQKRTAYGKSHSQQQSVQANAPQYGMREGMQYVTDANGKGGWATNAYNQGGGQMVNPMMHQYAVHQPQDNQVRYMMPQGQGYNMMNQQMPHHMPQQMQYIPQYGFISPQSHPQLYSVPMQQQHMMPVRMQPPQGQYREVRR